MAGPTLAACRVSADSLPANLLYRRAVDIVVASHEDERMRLWLGIAAALAVSCGGNNPTDKTADAICHAHFKSSTLSWDLKVQDAAAVGGHLGYSHWDERIAHYPPGDRVVRCLAPTGPDKAEVWDIVVSVDKTFLRWRQEGRGAPTVWTAPVS